MADYVKGIPSSFVTDDFVVMGENGAGESKFHFGPRSREAEFDTYFDFAGGTITYQFDKDNLLEYLNYAKLEYATEALQKYHNVDLNKWQSAYDFVDTCTDFRFALTKFTDAQRYYIRPDLTSTLYPDSGTLWDAVLRSLPLPKISNLEVEKDGTGSVITFRVFFDFRRLTRLPDPDFTFETSFHTDDYELNRIVFGAPGTGKSFTLDEDAAAFLDSPKYLERVTFYPDYTYAKFVGTYKPITVRGKVEYQFVPGPFMRILTKALQESKKPDPLPCVLIVEEINRANPASVFGDIFQLLDRGENGASQYSISLTKDMQDYLISIFGGDADHYEDFKLPNNLFIWATMNSADQGVFPVDTAFKRRWSFEYVGINENDADVHGLITLGLGTHAVEVDWNKLRIAINEKLTKEYKVNEDKLLGPYFLSKKLFKTVSDTDLHIADPGAFIKAFKSKVIMYLYEDAAKQHKHKLFSGCADTTKYSSVCDSFDDIGVEIFGDTFMTTYYRP